MRPKVVFALIVLTACALGHRFAGAPPDLSTPKAAVRSFVEALARHDASAMAQCVVEGKARQDVVDLVFSGKDGFSKLKVVDLVAEIEGDEARVAIEAEMQMSRGLEDMAATLTVVDILKVKKNGAEWRIVPEEKWGSAQNSMGLGLHIIRLLVSMVGPREEAANMLKQARRRAQEASCLSNAKQIGLAVMMYTQDYDELYPRKKVSYKDVVMPYIKQEELFRCTLDAEGTLSYRINPNLLGVSAEKVKYPTRTIMLYEGKGDKPEYRHDGRAAIVFADGRASMMTRAEVEAHYWYADGEKPARPAPKPVKPQKKTTGKRR
jgi:prepilin-type processing-associated H-X9-DG protein